MLHDPPAAETLLGRLERLCAFANESATDSGFIHPVVRTVLIH